MHFILVGSIIIACIVLFMVRRSKINTNASIKTWLSESGRSWCLKNTDSHDCDDLLAPLSIDDIANMDNVFFVKLMGRFQSGHGLDTITGLNGPSFIYGENSDSVPLVSVWYNSAQSVVFIAIRGTQNFKDLTTDLEYSQQTEAIWKTCKSFIHGGFIKLYTTIGDKIRDVIKPTVKRVYIVGHSLGASLAYLTGYDLAENHSEIDIFVYAIAPPKTGNEEFSDCIARTANLHVKTIINLADMIPSLIPSYAPNFKKGDKYKPFRFTHICPIFLFNIESTDILSNHNLPVYLDGVRSSKLVLID